MITKARSQHKYPFTMCPLRLTRNCQTLLFRFRRKKAYGQLVLLGFDVTAFTPAAYQGRRLQPPL